MKTPQFSYWVRMQFFLYLIHEPISAVPCPQTITSTKEKIIQGAPSLHPKIKQTRRQQPYGNNNQLHFCEEYQYCRSTL